MDELSIQDSRLTDALADLRVINSWLGGYVTSISAIAPFLRTANHGSVVRVIDIACGGGDFCEELIVWAHRNTPDVKLLVTGVDYSAATIAYARSYIDHRLPSHLATRITLVCADAFSLPLESNSFDIAHAALFAHHLTADSLAHLLREMNRIAKSGLVINDLHRHVVAYSGITLLTRLLRASSMVQHDGPLSVRRAFSRDELKRAAAAAGLARYEISWRWAFRWLLTTVQP